LCLPASRMGTHSRWLRLIVNLAIAALERERAAPALPVLFVLEEFAALGHMRALENAVAYMRGFGVKIWAVLQDVTQLKRHYKESWETFLGNAGVLQAFSVTDVSSLEYLSKRMGETTLQITNKVDVSTAQSNAGDTGLRREFRTQKLMNPDEISIKFAHKVAPDGRALGGLSLVLWSGKAPMMVERVYYGELVG
jgi:type IV secretion system protein VirD4